MSPHPLPSSSEALNWKVPPVIGILPPVTPLLSQLANVPLSLNFSLPAEPSSFDALGSAGENWPAALTAHVYVPLAGSTLAPGAAPPGAAPTPTRSATTRLQELS